MILNANALHIPLADGCVQTCVTSPPYWALRDYGQDGQLGLEETPELYVANMVAVFREVWRVLRDDGTLWLNLGDSYAGSWGNYAPGGIKGTQREQTEEGERWERQAYADTTRKPATANPGPGLKPKDLCGIPWRVAFALQADGWYLRSDIIWSKPNPMPESVTDRPTKAHEYLFLLSKSARYFFDQDAVREPQTQSTIERASYGWNGRTDDNSNGARTGSTFKRMAATGEPIGTIPEDGTRNIRTVWTIPTQPTPYAHFATYPEKLVEPCILAGTSARGCCPVCGKAWERVTELTPEYQAVLDSGKAWRDQKGKPDEYTNRHPHDHPSQVPPKNITTGWRPACAHDAEPVPCLVLDPFAGSGTTGKVALNNGRRFVGLELKFAYIRDIASRRMRTQIGMGI